MDYLMIVGGLVLLAVGGEILIRGAVAMAWRLGVTPLLISLTVIGFGTSLPELLVALQSALEGNPGIGVGNVIGSNIANILLILGTAAAFFPFTPAPAVLRRDMVMMLLTSLLFIGLAWYGHIRHWHGGVMVLVLISYIVFAYRLEKADPDKGIHAQEAESLNPESVSLRLGLLYLLLGFGGLIGGGRLLVNGAVGIAHDLGVPDAVIGLTIVAVGTSLPELATTVISGIRNQMEVAVGNVLGSNIFNILSIMGFTSLVTPVRINPQMLEFDVWLLLGVSVLIFPFLFLGWRMTRLLGGSFLLGYIAYTVYLYLQ